mgnify:CR=1 FL=1
MFLAAFGPLTLHWSAVIWVIAAATMVVGTVVGVTQSNVKRMLAYSSIAHAGYLLLGIAALITAGRSAVLYYLSGYLFTVLAAFSVIVVVMRHLETEDVSGLAGLHQRSPLLSFSMTLALVSLAGLPPLAGFFGKFYLFSSVVAGANRGARQTSPPVAATRSFQETEGQPLALRRAVVAGDFQGYVHFLSPDDGAFIGRLELDGAICRADSDESPGTCPILARRRDEEQPRIDRDGDFSIGRRDRGGPREPGHAPLRRRRGGDPPVQGAPEAAVRALSVAQATRPRARLPRDQRSVGRATRDERREAAPRPP